MKKWIVIVVLILAAIIVVVAGGGYLWFRYTLRKTLPQTSGTIVVQGLREEVEIIRDTYGVPHIYARNEADLMFAMGYAMAQDRLWQMEFNRRLGQGRLSEVFGANLVEVDRYFRMITAAGMTDEVSDQLAFILDSFAGGVNLYIETHRDQMPIEFTLLGHRPEPWSPKDSFYVLKVINWALSSGWGVDLTASKILEKVGEEKLRDAFPVWPEDGPLIIPQETRALAGVSNDTARATRTVRRLTGLQASAASNNWVVSGEKSATGKPILANDPHLGLTNPSFWWEVHLVSPTIDASGVSVVGTPGVSLGHNRHVAWGVTNVMVDDVDFYIEKINPDNPRQYWDGTHWAEMEVIEETIEVKDEEPVRIEILKTRHGPIVEELKGGSETKTISARWAFTEVPQPVEATYLLMKAKDIHDVTAALSHWVAPSQNIVFADTNGNIGYWCAATIPIRPKGDGMLPMPGWTGEYEWQGYASFEERPHLINPKEGFIATANNRVTGTDYPYPVSRYWEPMDRITRIRQLLKSKEKLSVEDFKRMQQDVYSLLAAEMTPLLIQALDRLLDGEEARMARDTLSKWDFMMDKDSVGACLFEVTYRKMMENTFRDELGDELFTDYLETASFPPRAMRAMLRTGSSPWFDDVKTPERETMEDILARSLTQMLSELKDLLGSDMTTWTWGRIHSLTFTHVLAEKKPLDRIFNLGPFPLGGSQLTVNKGQYPYEKPYRANVGASQRMIIDLSDMNASLRVIPTGQSGQPGSRHYKDQVGLYLAGQYHPDWTDRADIEKNSEAVLILKPE